MKHTLIAGGGDRVGPMSLQALLESDREMILSNLGRDRSPSAAQTVLFLNGHTSGYFSLS